MNRIFVGASAFFGAAATFLSALPAQMHCQVPCGIYGDGARLDAMAEDATTVRTVFTKHTPRCAHGSV
jgi:hypothetical protein